MYVCTHNHLCMFVCISLLAIVCLPAPMTVPACLLMSIQSVQTFYSREIPKYKLLYETIQI